MSKDAGFSGKIGLTIYVLVWVVVLVAAGAWLTSWLMGTIGDPFEGRHGKASQTAFDTVVALTEKKVVRRLGEWAFDEPDIPGHFHHIGRWYQTDKSNFCIRCHGPIPHSRSPQVRAFLNMHNLFISCQVCHVTERNPATPNQFGWQDVTYGNLCGTPDMSVETGGEYGSKIVLLSGSADSPSIMKMSEEEDVAREFLDRSERVDDRQRVIANKFIHRKCTENPITCTDCHDTQKAFLPYDKLGYPKDRTALLMSAEVADLAVSYQKFHIPNLLNTTNGSSDKAGGSE